MVQQTVARVLQMLFCILQKAQPTYLGHKFSPRISLQQHRR